MDGVTWGGGGGKVDGRDDKERVFGEYGGRGVEYGQGAGGLGRGKVDLHPRRAAGGWGEGEADVFLEISGGGGGGGRALIDCSELRLGMIQE